MLILSLYCRVLKGQMQVFNSTANEFIAKLCIYADGQVRVSMLEEFKRLTLQIIGKVSTRLNESILTTVCYLLLGAT